MSVSIRSINVALIVAFILVGIFLFHYKKRTLADESNVEVQTSASGIHDRAPVTSQTDNVMKKVQQNPELFDQDGGVSNAIGRTIEPDKRVLISDCGSLSTAERGEETSVQCDSLYFWNDFTSIRSTSDDSLDFADVKTLMKKRQTRLKN